MIENDLHRLVLYLPALTTLCAAYFCWELFSRYRVKGGGLHLLWWGIGMATYGIGTFTEAWTSIAGWNPAIFRLWYVSGAFLGGYPLAQGSIYLLMKRRFAHGSAIVMCSLIAVASAFVVLTPLDVGAAEAHRLSGSVIEWQWVRLISPFINLYSVVFLVGGAVVSALRFRRHPQLRNRYVGNILIAVGALLPGIGGSLTRAGYVEALYVTELAGLILIYLGYRKNIAGRPQRASAGSSTTRREESPVSRATLTALVLGLLALPGAGVPAAADEPPRDGVPAGRAAASASADAEAGEEAMGSFFASTTVTATGKEVSAFEISTPVTVLSEQEIERRQPLNAVDLLRTQPGVDVNGVGANQARPIIRGQRGLRVLFMENGLRLNNPRRQTDFGEVSGLVDIDHVAKVEVVRGPASVLYGTDAIGGVLNLITESPSFGAPLGGSFGLRYGSAGDLADVQASVHGGRERLSYHLGLSYRDQDDYQAPDGTFGDIRLDREVDVIDTGVQDDSLYGVLDYRLSDSSELTFRWSRYRADETGFGFVEPAEIGADDPTRIRILYPFQDFDRYTLGYSGSAFGSPVADSAHVQLYFQDNERQLVNDIDIDIGPIFPGAPSSEVLADTRNFTDLETLGLRAEAVKVAGEDHLLTYGLEAFEDDSFNTDFSETTTILRFPFPPFETIDVLEDSVPNAPNATNRSWGLFVQDEIAASDRLRLTVGARYQTVETEAEPTVGFDTAGLDFDDDALVGSVNATYGVSENLNLVASYGTAFRAPNIVERLFNGPTPEGIGFQILNPELESEESENFDVGLKYLRRNAVFEVIYFENDIEDGIVQNFLSDEQIEELPQDLQDEIEASGVDFVVQQVNAEKLRFEGVEVVAGWRADNGFSVGGNYTHLDGRRLDSTNPPTGDVVSDKYNLYLRWEQAGGRNLWAEYRVRHNSSQRANLDPDEPVPPVGEVLPSFTVHALSGGATLFATGSTEHDLTVVLENATDELYAEFSNATFFRPQPERNVTVSYRLRF